MPSPLKQRLPLKERLPRILETLDRTYPDAKCSLTHADPLQLLVATILSAQCTDVLVNKVTPDLFKRYPTAAHFADAPLAELQQAVNRVNYYRNKAKFIQQACRLLLERHGGNVPSTMPALLELPGVARKTANVVLGDAFGVSEGVVVDTHVLRITRRLGMTSGENRNAIEQKLMKLLPPERWAGFSHQIILHGRAICKAIRPLCSQCPIGQALCPSYRDERASVNASGQAPRRNRRKQRA